MLIAAPTPTVTRVNASPRLKQITSVAPSVTAFNWRHINKTVIAAGQGIKPPVNPKINICQLVTSFPLKRRLISFACAN